MKMLGDNSRADKAVSLYRERFSETGIYESTIYEGIVETLAALIHHKRQLFVATSKLQTFAKRIVVNFNLAPYFEGVFGAGMDGTRADKTEPLKHALDIGRVDPARAVMVGDRSCDIIGARNNGMPRSASCTATAARKNSQARMSAPMGATPREEHGALAYKQRRPR